MHTKHVKVVEKFTYDWEKYTEVIGFFLYPDNAEKAERKIQERFYHE